MSSLQNEEKISLSNLAKELGVTYVAVYGYVKKGLISNSGNPVFLESTRLTSGMFTSRESYQRFIEKLNH